MIKLVLNSLKAFSSEKKMWLLLFLFSLVPALVFGVIFYQKAVGVSSTSLEVNRLFANFDFMTFSDFMKSGKDELKPLYIGAVIAGFVFLFISIFLSGGVVERALQSTEKFSFSSFFANSLRRFPRFLLVYLFVLILAFCFFLACGLLYFIASLMAENGDDKSLTIWLSIPTLILVIFMSFTVCVSDYTKVLIAKYPFLPTSEAFGKAFGYAWKRPKALGSMWILVVLSLLSLALYLLLDKTVGMISVIGIVVMVFIQQVYSFFRIFLRFSHLKVASDFYDADPLDIREPVEEVIADISEEQDITFENKEEPPQAETGLDIKPDKEP